MHSLIIEFALRGCPKPEFCKGQKLLSLQLKDAALTSLFNIDYCTFVRLYSIPNHSWRSALLTAQKRFSAKENFIFLICAGIEGNTQNGHNTENISSLTKEECSYMDLLAMRYNVSRNVWDMNELTLPSPMLWKRVEWNAIHGWYLF